MSLQGGAHPEFFTGGPGTITLRVDIIFWPQIYVTKPCHKYTVTWYFLQLHLRKYKYIHMFSDSTNLILIARSSWFFLFQLRHPEFLFYFSKFQCTSQQLISVVYFVWKVIHVGCLISSCLKKSVFFKNFYLWEELQPSIPLFRCASESM